MANKRRKWMQPSAGSSVVQAHPIRNDRKWRLLARLRNGSLLCFLVTLVGSVSLFLLTSPQFRNPPLKGRWDSVAVTLGICWFVSNGLGLLFHSLLVKHVRRTLRRRDVVGLSGWINHILGPSSPDNGTSEAQQCNAEMRTALLEQLPLLTEETTFLLYPGDRNSLYRALYKEDMEMIAVVLQVIPILGDARALRGVQYLADGKGAGAAHPELQADAQATLTRLQARLDPLRRSHGLLRASQPPQLLRQELLLPTQANNQTDPGELLRPDPPR
jgi:hypothetical protein